ncbi:TPA: NTP transferase domain-containing protein [Candidatus Micrarchaeota archaeon]|nr:MAG: hypothetical protein AUJ65_05330 [Candidatus Micrarchaeota archaeon CG1_02_51_15]HII38699.1 NTP transferase domain-containing protein [Candidatus Micrarchaeota archaeon]
MKPDYVVLAAGHGKRLWPLSETTCKPMARILSKPVLEWTVENALPNANKIILVVGQLKEQVTDYFSSKPYADRVVFVEQPRQMGTGHALLQAEPVVESGSLVMINGDNFFHPSVFKLLAEECIKKEWFAVTRNVADRSPYGAYYLSKGFIERVVEKPTDGTPGPININLFHAPKSFFKLLEKIKPSPRGEIEVTDALQYFFSENRVRAIDFKGYWNDIGTYWNYLDANTFACSELMQPKIAGTIEEGAQIGGKLWLGKGSIVKAGALIQGNCFVGENCIIGRGAELRGDNVVENNCTVGAAQLKSCVMLEGSKTEDGAVATYSVLCEDSKIGRNARLSCRSKDGQTVKVNVNGKHLDSRRSELGSVIGRGIHLGENTLVAPGAIINSIE